MSFYAKHCEEDKWTNSVFCEGGNAHPLHPPVGPVVLLCVHGFSLLEHPSAGIQQGPSLPLCPLQGSSQLGCEHILCRAHLMQLTTGTEIMSVRYGRKGSIPRRL